MLVAAACAFICFFSIAIVASSKSHSFDPQRVNMTHRVHQLSFINPVQEGTHLLTKDKEKMFRSESMNEKWHVSKEGHASIEHYVKVLSRPSTQPQAPNVIPNLNCAAGAACHGYQRHGIHRGGVQVYQRIRPRQ